MGAFLRNLHKLDGDYCKALLRVEGGGCGRRVRSLVRAKKEGASIGWSRVQGSGFRVWGLGFRDSSRCLPRSLEMAGFTAMRLAGALFKLEHVVPASRTDIVSRNPKTLNPDTSARRAAKNT